MTAVADFAELISLCTQARAEGRAPGQDGAAWAATAALVGTSDGQLSRARVALRRDGDPEPLRELAQASAGREPWAGRSRDGAHAGRVK